MSEYFVFGGNISAKSDEKMNNETVKRLWNSFCLTDGEISLEVGEKNTFKIGNAPNVTLPTDKEYAISVRENGLSVVGKDYNGLIRGFISLIMKIEYSDSDFRIKCFYEESEYSVRNRMIHICVFPENDLYFIKKLVRLCGLCQFTHIVIEFWGMLRYDCLKELSWPHAFTKDEVRALVKEARELGMEPIPMFNMFGHASSSRFCYGKHVVLDQNPRLQYLFTPDGWAWDIRSDKVAELLKNVREELYEVFGSGEYIHIGCDEAYYYTRSDKDREYMPEFLHRLTCEVESEGRRPMLWMDMILDSERFKHPYFAFGKAGETDKLIASLSKNCVMVDWQYDKNDAPIETSISLLESGHDVVIAPWLNESNFRACVKTAEDSGLFGVMLTTWHILRDRMPGIIGFAKRCNASLFTWAELSGDHEMTATALRRVSFEGNSYEDYGWSKRQIET
ncbi:MAG: family 20 glycosylhydrolase [Clostridia bacterium]|nr:family 20 glycosylhydrolase [Clostridia bacterium]MBQ9749455.1 family 20 glycosylhydrolase [Clostridia bacterium]